MPELAWDETDFLACLEVEPQIEEYGMAYHYEVSRGTLTLFVSVWPYESVVALSLLAQDTQETTTNITLWLAIRGAVHYIHDKRGEFLEFNDCVVISTRFFSGAIESVFDKTKLPGDLQMTLRIKPTIQIAFR